MDDLAEDETRGREPRAQALYIVEPVLLGTVEIAVYAGMREVRRGRCDSVVGEPLGHDPSAGRTFTMSRNRPSVLGFISTRQGRLSRAPSATSSAISGNPAAAIA